jgi:hypothetical protein
MRGYENGNPVSKLLGRIESWSTHSGLTAEPYESFIALEWDVADVLTASGLVQQLCTTDP